MWNTILFDLDGTLTDSAEGITKSVQYALAHFGIQETDLKKLECFVGPPLKEQFMKYCGFSEEQGQEAVRVYRERYSKIGIWENHAYMGIKEMLAKLCTRGYTLGVASSKPTHFVKQILERFELLPYFEVVVGSELDGSRTDKAEVIEEALRQLQIREYRQRVLMVGDKEHDVNGARRVGIPCVGVAYGYGSREELLRAQPLAIVYSVPELAAFLIDGRLERQEAAKPQETGQKDRLDLHRGRPLLKVWRVLYPVGIHFAASIVASLIVIIPMTVYALMGGSAGADAVSTIGLTGLMEILAIPFLLYFMKKDRILRENLGAEGIKTKASPVLVLILLFAAAALSDLLSQGMAVLRIPDLFPYYGEMTDEMYAQSSFIVILAVVGVLAPVAEEMVFRGLVYARLKDYLGGRWGILLSGFIFGIYHGNMVQFIFAFCLGCWFAWLYQKSGNLLIPILAHVAVNVWSCILTYIPSDSGFWTWYPLLIVAEILIAVWGCYYLSQNYKKTGKSSQTI